MCYPGNRLSIRDQSQMPGSGPNMGPSRPSVYTGTFSRMDLLFCRSNYRLDLCFKSYLSYFSKGKKIIYVGSVELLIPELKAWKQCILTGTNLRIRCQHRSAKKRQVSRQPYIKLRFHFPYFDKEIVVVILSFTVKQESSEKFNRIFRALEF